MFQTTRRRLALWYTTVTAILLLLFASGFYLYVRGTLIERIDDTLSHVVEVMQRSLVIEPVNPHSEGGALRVNIEASFRDNAATSEDDRIDLEWFSPTGELLWSTFSESIPAPLNPNSDGETVRIERNLAIKQTEGTAALEKATGSRTSVLKAKPLATLEPLILRQVTHRVEVGRQVLGYLRVSHPWFEVTKPTRQLFFDLAVGIVAMIGVVGSIGWFLSGLAMEPVRESYQRLKQFTADASHELRSPIAVIQTNVQVALADPDPDPAMQQHHLRVVERLTRRLGRLVDDLLFLARQDSGIVQPRWTTINLEALLREVLEEQQSLAQEKAIQLTFNVLSSSFNAESNAVPTTEEPKNEPQETWGVMQGDRDQLARLFTNLVGNAVHYTPQQGKICVELQKKSGRQNYPCLRVTIRDTGIGIPEEMLPRVFDRFYRVDPARTQTSAGSGLGLAIAQAIVQNHQGQIQIDSTVNQGTTVTVTLPLALKD